MNALKLIAIAILGYAGYEAWQAYQRHRITSEGPTGPGQRAIREQRGEPRREPVTGGGEGRKVHTVNRDGESVSTTVGRGVVSRG